MKFGIAKVRMDVVRTRRRKGRSVRATKYASGTPKSTHPNVAAPAVQKEFHNARRRAGSLKKSA